MEAPREKEVRSTNATEGVVLVVEDDPSVLEVTRRVLERGGFTVRTAADAAEAMRILGARGRIDLVLTDLFLPGTRGGSVARRALELDPGRPVLVMSGQPEHSAKAERLPEQVTYLQKPFTRDMLIEAVGSALSRP